VGTVGQPVTLTAWAATSAADDRVRSTLATRGRTSRRVPGATEPPPASSADG
jgi:hypothetical protein